MGQSSRIKNKKNIDYMFLNSRGEDRISDGVGRCEDFGNRWWICGPGIVGIFC
jgi:hypothetical protein